jgi:hypothetical protein
MTSQRIERHTGLEYSIEMVYRTEYSLVIAIRHDCRVEVADQYGRLQQSELRLGGVGAGLPGSFVVGAGDSGLAHLLP